MDVLVVLLHLCPVTLHLFVVEQLASGGVLQCLCCVDSCLLVNSEQIETHYDRTSTVHEYINAWKL